MLTRNLSCCS